MRTKEDARALIDAVKKVPLGFYPTPFHKLERMSELTGVNLWVKREDFSGVSLFGGNKVRKLEFLLADAVRKGCDTVFTYGATESNHAMQTATAARKLGLKPVLWLGDCGAESRGASREHAARQNSRRGNPYSGIPREYAGDHGSESGALRKTEE